MDPQPGLPPPQPSQPSPVLPVRTVQISLQPKTWFGKIIAAIVGVAVALVAFFVSIVALAVIAVIVVVAIAYFFWATRRARRKMRSEPVDDGILARDRTPGTSPPGRGQTIDATPESRNVE